MSAPGGFPSSEQQPQGRGPQQRQSPLSKEELEVLRECNKESFWYRCVPFGLAIMGGTEYLVYSGVLKPHPKYGTLFKNMAGLLVGYIAGKISYQPACRLKILERIPNSGLAQAIFMRGPFDPSQDMGSVGQVPPPRMNEAPPVRDEMRSSDFDMDKTPTQIPKGLDDSQRPTLDKEGFRPLGGSSDESSPEYKSYDDLRRQNRMGYDKKMASKESSPFNQRPWPPPGPYANPGQSAPDQGRQPWSGRRPERDTSSSGKGKNKYGDEWDD